LKKLILAFLLAVALLFTTGCGSTGYMVKDENGNFVMPDFQDGTYTECTYTSKDGKEVYTSPPVRMGGAAPKIKRPGFDVECKRIPKA
jgi:hypothetical protein